VTNKGPQLDFEALSDAAKCLRILAHPRRLQIVRMFLAGSKYSFNEIAEACGFRLR